ncbi:hypothetical protein HF319_00275 [Xanthomonas sp. Kuri4-1]
MNFLSRKSLVAIAIGGVALAGSNLGATPWYEIVPYGNDPFTFCTVGMPSDGWVAVNPAVGAWTPIRHYPNLFWTGAYERVCPKAFGQ